MFVKYRPEDSADGDPQDWVFVAGRVKASKAEMIEKRYGKPWGMFSSAILAGEAHARRVLLWHLLSTAHPAFRWEDTPDFAMDEFTVEHSYAELEALYDQAKSSGAPQDVLDSVEAQRENAPDAPGRGGEPEGKAPSATGAESGNTP